MRRILLLIIAVAVAAYAGWYYWNFSQQISSAPVAGLLPRDPIFLALTSISDSAPSVVGGFRFRGTQEEVERVIGKWRAMLLDQGPETKGEKLQYQGHEIYVAKATPFTLATTYDRPWFFAATNVA